MKNFLWTEEETATLTAMMRAGFGFDDVAAKLPGRSRQSVKERWRWINRSEEIKQARRDRVNRYRAEHRGEPDPGVRRSMPMQHVPADILIDRDTRLLAPRSITGTICGDPPPGFSALDRKRQGADA